MMKIAISAACAVLASSNLVFANPRGLTAPVPEKPVAKGTLRERFAEGMMIQFSFEESPPAQRKLFEDKFGSDKFTVHIAFYEVLTGTAKSAVAYMIRRPRKFSVDDGLAFEALEGFPVNHFNSPVVGEFYSPVSHQLIKVVQVDTKIDVWFKDLIGGDPLNHERSGSWNYVGRADYRMHGGGFGLSSPRVETVKRLIYANEWQNIYAGKLLAETPDWYPVEDEEVFDPERAQTLESEVFQIWKKQTCDLDLKGSKHVN